MACSSYWRMLYFLNCECEDIHLLIFKMYSPASIQIMISGHRNKIEDNQHYLECLCLDWFKGIFDSNQQPASIFKLLLDFIDLYLIYLY